MNYNQDDWARLLATTQFRLNNSVNKVIEKAPFDIIYYYKPEMRMNIVFIIKDNFLLGEAPATRQEVKLREKDEKTLRKLWEKTQNIIKKYYDTRRKDISFKIKEKILLNTKNLRVRKLYKKLTDRYIRPFKITKAVGLNIY